MFGDTTLAFSLPPQCSSFLEGSLIAISPPSTPGAPSRPESHTLFLHPYPAWLREGPGVYLLQSRASSCAVPTWTHPDGPEETCQAVVAGLCDDAQDLGSP